MIARFARSVFAAAVIISAAGAALASGGEHPQDIKYVTAPPAPRGQTPEEQQAKSEGCLTCHTATDEPTMHQTPGLSIGCVDCHGGDSAVRAPAASAHDMPGYVEAKRRAHVLPRYPETWHYPSSANPERTYTLLNKESPEYIRFVNPSDLRIAREACGACHERIIRSAERSMMATGAQLWGGAAYNNGIIPFKNYAFGEAYTREGESAVLKSPLEVDERMAKRGNLSTFYPLPSWETMPPGDIFRVFERGGRNIVTQFPEIGLPNSLGQLQRLEEPGRPDIRQSNRGAATGLRIAVPVINIHKTRLNDPSTWFLGTNDQPGDFRTSGCGSCHVVYANDRDPRHAGPYAKFGHWGTTQTVDPTIPRSEPGHPLEHRFTRAIPTSQCMICHMHQPNIFLNTFLGYTMWDYEGAPAMYPPEQRDPSIAESRAELDRNPEAAVLRGKWGDVNFVSQVAELNPQNKNQQFADYHGHGWNFRAIYKRDRKGNLLDEAGRIIANEDPDKFKKAVHMSSIHLDLGMHCVDCHFSQDAHGNGYIQGETSNAVEIRCADCHGTTTQYPSLHTSGPAARPGGTPLVNYRNSDGKRRFEWRGEKLIQRSAVNPGLEWDVSLVKDTVDPTNPRYNPKAARSKLMSKGTSMQWGPGIAPENRAHSGGDGESMACFTCHLSWTTSCAGCHLPIEANWKTERHHFEGGETRNWASYNPQVARDDMFQLGRHQTTKNNQIAPIASRSALILSSTNINRDRIYIQQPPISAAGFSSQAFSAHYPHTERKVETKTCTDCHLSEANDNNAIMTQLLLYGTNFVNFVGYNAWLGLDGGVEAIRVTEWDEPQAVIGSELHSQAYPTWYQEHQANGRELRDTAHAGDTSNSHGGGRSKCVVLRGEYLFAAEGRDGMQVYDVASIANKSISQRILTSPFGSPGQDTHIASRNATCIALPTNQNINPLRNEGELMRVQNQEQPFHPIYSYAFITDAEEGLIVTDVRTLADGDPRNNYLARALTWNEGGILNGARHVTIAGHIFYVAADAGIVVLNMDQPLQPKVLTVIPMADVRATANQFRYLFAVDREGMKVIDITHPERPRIVPNAVVPLRQAERIYVARTFAYVANGADGLAIIDVEKAEQPRLYTMYTADGQLNDAQDVVVGTTNASLYAYVADGRNGLKVIQLTGPTIQPNFYGFSPDPNPTLIAWRRTIRPALALAKGLDRDRGVDETGHQMAVFGRLGSRPFTLEESQRLYLDVNGAPWFVSDEVRMRDFVPGAGQPRADVSPAVPLTPRVEAPPPRTLKPRAQAPRTTPPRVRAQDQAPGTPRADTSPAAPKADGAPAPRADGAPEPARPDPAQRPRADASSPGAPDPRP